MGTRLERSRHQFNTNGAHRTVYNFLMLAAICLFVLAKVESGHITLSDGSNLTVFFTDRLHQWCWRPDGTSIPVNRLLEQQLSVDDEAHPGLFEVDAVLLPAKAITAAPFVYVSLTKGPRSGISSSAAKSTVIAGKKIWMLKGQEFHEIPSNQDIQVDVNLPSKEPDSWVEYRRAKDGIEPLHSGGKPLRLKVSGVDHPKVIGQSNLIPGPMTVVTVPEFAYTNDCSWDLAVYGATGKRLSIGSVAPHKLLGVAVSHLTDYYFFGNVRSVKRVEVWKRKKELHIIKGAHFTPSTSTEGK